MFGLPAVVCPQCQRVSQVVFQENAAIWSFVDPATLNLVIRVSCPECSFKFDPEGHWFDLEEVPTGNLKIKKPVLKTPK